MQIISPVQQVFHPLFSQHNIHVSIKRDDLIHPVISGNKWRKLLFNIQAAKKLNARRIISFGGAYSNHIHALAFACQQENIPSLGIIRGEQHYLNNSTLSQVSQWGMQCQFVNRETYKKRHDKTYLAELQNQYPNDYIVPEGGSNSLAVEGVAMMMDELLAQANFDSLFVPVGSGGTLAGIIAGDSQAHKIYGVSVLKQGEYLNDEVIKLLPENAKSYQNWKILTQYHGGGYGKFSSQAAQDIQSFSQTTQIPFEPIYSGKMILAILHLTQQGFFPSGHRIMLIHTGGLQGLWGLNERKKIVLSDWLLPSSRT